MKTLLPGWKNLVAEAMKEELPVPAFSSALNYFYSLTSADLPANLVQAQRDYFGAHTSSAKTSCVDSFSMKIGRDTEEIRNRVHTMCEKGEKMMKKLVIVIFGASGDLTKRKLMPALYTLYSGGRLPEGFSILG